MRENRWGDGTESRGNVDLKFFIHGRVTNKCLRDQVVSWLTIALTKCGGLQTVWGCSGGCLAYVFFSG